MYIAPFLSSLDVDLLIIALGLRQWLACSVPCPGPSASPFYVTSSIQHFLVGPCDGLSFSVHCGVASYWWLGIVRRCFAFSISSLICRLGRRGVCR